MAWEKIVAVGCALSSMKTTACCLIPAERSALLAPRFVIYLNHSALLFIIAVWLSIVIGCNFFCHSYSYLLI